MGCVLPFPSKQQLQQRPWHALIAWRPASQLGVLALLLRLNSNFISTRRAGRCRPPAATAAADASIMALRYAAAGDSASCSDWFWRALASSMPATVHTRNTASILQCRSGRACCGGMHRWH